MRNLWKFNAISQYKGIEHKFTTKYQIFVF
jgi:hypothetical protein